MFDEIDARLAARDDLGMKANSHPRYCEAWRFYEDEYQNLITKQEKLRT